MSNIEAAPQEILCASDTVDDPGEALVSATPQLLEPRNVPLGGIRAMNVRRTLPQRERSLIGAWCFLDHYGPDVVSRTGGMQVPRHPHTGLQTVSWLFTGEIDHLDSAGFSARVRPGEINLMTAGNGISHSEFSTPETTTLHGAQLWVVLPEHARFMPPTFENYRPEPITTPEWSASVFIGDLLGDSSPVTAHTPLVGAEITLQPGGELVLDHVNGLRRDFEYGVLLDVGSIEANGTPVASDHLAYFEPGQTSLSLAAGAQGARILLIGGEPFGEQIIMWWNFVGRDHDEIVEYRATWQREIAAEEAEESVEAPRVRARYAAEQFGPFPPEQPAPLLAPVMPMTRLKPRK